MLLFFNYDVDTKNFKFPALNAETEKFLWRRKADLEISLRELDSISSKFKYFSCNL